MCMYVTHMQTVWLIIIKHLQFSGTGVAADTAAGRIMELSKKNRELTADLESERNKSRQMTKKVKEMEREVPDNEVLDHVNFTIMLASVAPNLIFEAQ